MSPDPSFFGEMLKRLGKKRETLNKLTQRAKEAERVLRIHGVSVTAGEEEREHSWARRSDVEKHFRVHDTPTMKNPLHRTVELPKPVTQEIVDRFNDLFGRK